jgi:molecular chaperone GrpE
MESASFRGVFASMNDDSVERGGPAQGASPDQDPEQRREQEGDRSDPGSPDELRAQAQENWNKYLRTVAEIDNIRKRNARELENARKFGAERLASRILPVRDSLEAGLAAATAEDGTVDVEALIEGERATLRLLDQALEAAEIREIDPLGEPFDPAKHEAMSTQPSDSAEPDTVVLVVQKGYELHDRLLRPARVIVSRTP